MSNLIERENLPQKALVIHQFRDGSVKRRKDIKQPAGVDVVLNFDGIGGAAAKKAGYARLTREDLFAGFSLFYRLDSGLMKPGEVLRLEPEPDFFSISSDTSAPGASRDASRTDLRFNVRFR